MMQIFFNFIFIFFSFFAYCDTTFYMGVVDDSITFKNPRLTKLNADTFTTTDLLSSEFKARNFIPGAIAISNSGQYAFIGGAQGNPNFLVVDLHKEEIVSSLLLLGNAPFKAILFSKSDDDTYLFADCTVDSDQSPRYLLKIDIQDPLNVSLYETYTVSTNTSDYYPYSICQDSTYLYFSSADGLSISRIDKSSFINLDSNWQVTPTLNPEIESIGFMVIDPTSNHLYFNIVTLIGVQLVKCNIQTKQLSLLDYLSWGPLAIDPSFSYFYTFSGFLQFDRLFINQDSLNKLHSKILKANLSQFTALAISAQGDKIVSTGNGYEIYSNLMGAFKNENQKIGSLYVTSICYQPGSFIHPNKQLVDLFRLTKNIFYEK